MTREKTDRRGEQREQGPGEGPGGRAGRGWRQEGSPALAQSPEAGTSQNQAQGLDQRSAQRPAWREGRNPAREAVQEDLFEACRRVPAAEAAGRLNIGIKWRGGRGWALCPLHGEARPSLMFDDKGRWHCFGCGRGGDAVALYAQVKGLRPIEAARALLGRADEADAVSKSRSGDGGRTDLRAIAEGWRRSVVIALDQASTEKAVVTTEAELTAIANAWRRSVIGHPATIKEARTAVTADATPSPPSPQATPTFPTPEANA